MYNKKRFRKVNDKKVLRKSKKQWVVVSLSLLGALGLGGATEQAHANIVKSPQVPSNSDQKQTVRMPQSNVTLRSANVAQPANGSSANDLTMIQRQANLLHNQILNHAQENLNSTPVESSGAAQANASSVSGNKSAANDDGVTNGTPEHQRSLTNGSDNQFTPQARVTDKIITGTWGTAPYYFDQDTGVLSTTGSGQITPIQLMDSRVKADRIRQIELTGGPVTIQGNNASDVFARLPNVDQIDLADLDTRGVNDMSDMFASDRGLSQIQFGSNFNTSDVTGMTRMFNDDPTLRNLDLSHFNMNNVNNMLDMLHDTPGLKQITIGSNVHLASDVGLAPKWYREDRDGYTSMTPVNLNTDTLEPGVYRSTPNVNPEFHVTGKWGSASFDFNPADGVLQTTSGGVITPIQSLGDVDHHVVLSDVKAIKFAPGTQAPDDSEGLFSARMESVPTTDGASDSIAYISTLRNLKNIDCTNLDTDNVVNMGYMFENDTGLKQIKFGPKFNTSKVEATALMFSNDSDLESLDLSSFNTGNVLDMDSMFQNDPVLTSINLGSHFSTQNVVYMYNMFKGDNSLKTLDLGTLFYVNYPKSLSDMFANDYNLQSINLGNHFNTSSVTNMSDMFAYDSDLEALDLGDQFDARQASNLHAMFKGNTNLKTLNLGRHFDTTFASHHKIHFNGDVYNGAYDIFNGDSSLNHLILNNTRLTGPVSLVTPTLMNWYVTSDGTPQGNPVNLTDGQAHNGNYQLSSSDPAVETELNFQDVKDDYQSIGQILVKGMQGTNVPYSVISNALGAGYVSAIPVQSLMKTFPNTPYKYHVGIVNVPVKRIGKVSMNGNRTPVTPDNASEAGQVESYQASLTASVKPSAGSSAKSAHDASDVASSVARSQADSAAESADKSIDSSIANSAANAADQRIDDSIASSYAQSADHNIMQSYQSMINRSVASDNLAKARSAAQATDHKIDNSIATSAARSADQQIDSSVANSAAKSADRKIDASIADSAAQVADHKIGLWYLNSVSTSVSIENYNRARSAAQVADQKIDNSIATSAAQSADQKIAASVARSQMNSKAQSAKAPRSSSVSIPSSSASSAHRYSVKSMTINSMIAHVVSVLNTSSSSRNTSGQPANLTQVRSTESFSNKSNIPTMNSASGYVPHSAVTNNSVSSASVDNRNETHSSITGSSVASVMTTVNSSSNSANDTRQFENSVTNDSVNASSNTLNAVMSNASEVQNRAETAPKHSAVSRPVKQVRRSRRATGYWANVNRPIEFYVHGHAKNLRSGHTVKVLNARRVTMNRHWVTRYEVQQGRRRGFVYSNRKFARPAYIQPEGHRRHHFIMVMKPCFIHRGVHYSVNNRIREVRRGQVLRVKRIFYLDRSHMTRIELTNGAFITANRKFVKLI